MRELAVQAQNASNSVADKANINKEFGALATEMDRVADDTTFNNLKIMNGDTTTALFNVGADASDDLTVTFKDFNLNAGANTATAAVYDLVLTNANLQAIADTSSVIITNELGETATVLKTDLTDAGATTGFSDATNAEFVTALNAAIARSTGFDAVTARAGGNGFEFVQNAAGTGSILSVQEVTSANVSTNVGTVSNTTPYASGSGIMGINMDSANWKTGTSSVAENGNTLGYIDTAITNVVAARADFGAAISSLEFTIDNLQVGVQNVSAAKSAVMDADYAAETTELARTQIIAQASTAMLSQANQAAQSVLALLK
jgi:flagellin